MSKAIVIGAGIGGLATAIRLAHKGYRVEVFEANDYVGGKLSTFRLGDYRFDAGPSLFTMPHFVDELFALCGENPKDFFEYKRKDIACKYFWEDGVQLTAYGDTQCFLSEVEEKLQV
ncbi:MAG: phytoene desaturase family protein, partial [Flavobacteriaceae bacterium]